MINRNLLYDYIKNPSALNESSLERINEFIGEYPFFQTAQVLLVKNLRNIDSIRFDNQLKIAAVYASDRKKLFRLIHGDLESFSDVVEMENKSKTEELQKLKAESDATTEAKTEIIAETEIKETATGKETENETSSIIETDDKIVCENNVETVNEIKEDEVHIINEVDHKDEIKADSEKKTETINEIPEDTEIVKDAAIINETKAEETAQPEEKTAPEIKTTESESSPKTIADTVMQKVGGFQEKKEEKKTSAADDILRKYREEKQRKEQGNVPEKKEIQSLLVEEPVEDKIQPEIEVTGENVEVPTEQTDIKAEIVVHEEIIADNHFEDKEAPDDKLVEPAISGRENKAEFENKAAVEEKEVPEIKTEEYQTSPKTLADVVMRKVSDLQTSKEGKKTSAADEILRKYQEEKQRKAKLKAEAAQNEDKVKPDEERLKQEAADKAKAEEERKKIETEAKEKAEQEEKLRIETEAREKAEQEEKQNSLIEKEKTEQDFKLKLIAEAKRKREEKERKKEQEKANLSETAALINQQKETASEPVGKPLTNEVKSFDQWLNQFVSAGLQPTTKSKHDDLIENFIKSEPRIKPKKEIIEIKDISTKSVVDSDEFITETLAKIYIKQGLFNKAINVFEKLSLKYPEKSIYFAAQIEKLKNS
ncbi:MAG TPA: hypothetical protein DEA97_21355 [Bacteroidales bacterium]|nr:hypothetical protein [Bacteroidales bacterium]